MLELSSKDKSLVSRELATIAREKGKLSTREQAGELVARSKREGSPTHHLFPWDVRKAAEAHWLLLATRYVAVVRVVFQATPKVRVSAPIPMKLVKSEGVKVEPRAVSLSKSLLEQAKGELEAWGRRYEMLRDTDELGPVFEIMEGWREGGGERTTSTALARSLPEPEFVEGVKGREAIIEAVLEAQRKVLAARVEGLSPEAKSRRERDARVAVAKVVKSNDGLVAKAAKRYASHAKSVQEDDKMQAGRMGVIRAIETYDPSQGLWTTYAWQWIRQSITRMVHDEDDDIRKPVHFRESQYKICRARTAIEAEGKEATPEAIAERANLEVSIVRRAMDPSMRAPMSLSTPRGTMGSEESMTLQDFIEGDVGEDIERLDARKADKKYVDFIMADLSERERRVIEARMWDDKTLEQISETEDLTRERIRQIQNLALDKMRAKSRRYRRLPTEAA